MRSVEFISWLHWSLVGISQNTRFYALIAKLLRKKKCFMLMSEYAFMYVPPSMSQNGYCRNNISKVWRVLCKLYETSFVTVQANPFSTLNEIMDIRKFLRVLRRSDLPIAPQKTNLLQIFIGHRSIWYAKILFDIFCILMVDVNLVA